MIEGDVETIDEINSLFRQHVRCGEREGEAGYQTSFIQNYEFFTDILLGCTTHLAKELTVKNEIKFPHINGAKRLAYITGCCDSKERFGEADAAVSKFYSAAKGAVDTGFSLDAYQLMDHDVYVVELDCEPRNDDLKSSIVTAAFSGCHLEFMEERAYDLNLDYFRRDGKLYMDCRHILSLFLMFML